MKNIRKKFPGKSHGCAVAIVATGETAVGALVTLLALLQRGEQAVGGGSLSLVVGSQGEEIPRALDEAGVLVEMHDAPQLAKETCIMTPNDPGERLNVLRCFSAEAILIDHRKMLKNGTPCSAVEKWVKRGTDRFGLCYEVAQKGALAERMMVDGVVGFCRALGVFAKGGVGACQQTSAAVYELMNRVNVDQQQFEWGIIPFHLKKIAKGQAIGRFADLRTPGRNGNTGGWQWGMPVNAGKEGVLVYPTEGALRRGEAIMYFAVKK